MRVLIKLAREYPWQSIVALIAVMVSGVAEGLSLSMLLPLVSMIIAGNSSATSSVVGNTLDDGDGLEQKIMGTLTALGITPTIEVLLVVFVGGIVFRSALGLFVARLVGFTGAQIATNFRLSLLRALLASRWEYFLHQRIGKIANAMSGEAMRASVVYSFGIKLAGLVFELIVYCGLALLVAWKATVVAMGIGIIILVSLQWLVRVARDAGEKQTELMKSLITRLTDVLRSVKPLKAMAREDVAGAVLATETNQLNDALRQQVLSGAAMSAFQPAMFAATVASALYVALFYWSMSLAAVMLMVVLLSRVLKRMGNIQKAYQDIVTAESAYWSLQKNIKKAKKAHELKKGTQRPVFKRALRLDHVDFAYGSKVVLRDLNFVLPVGSFTTIVGPSGEGKTTLVDLVTGLLRPQAGQISIDDVQLEQIDTRLWRRKIGYVPQETLLLHDTVLANVTLGDPQLSEQDAEIALRASGAWDFVAALSEGMHSIVGEQGAKLSGGQRQRIVIARALAHKPALVILDEATSALDVDSEAAICETLQGLRGEFTILAISHRPGFVDFADQVYRIQDRNAELVPQAPEQPVTASSI